METNVVQFNNWSNEDITCFWNGNPYKFPANSVQPIYIGSYEDNLGVRDVFAYNLAVRELNKEGIVPSHDGAQIVKDYMSKATTVPDVVETVPEIKKTAKAKKEEETFEEA